MNDTVRQAIGRALGIRSRWILPLSSGMDSRLIAAVGSEMGINFRAYTWGESNATDVVYGRKIAECLDIPWKHVELGREYLLKYTGPWTDLFGTAMQFFAGSR
jgi:asparagine synthetase B (glutamine-hydrolysing)